MEQFYCLEEIKKCPEEFKKCPKNTKNVHNTPTVNFLITQAIMLFARVMVTKGRSQPWFSTVWGPFDLPPGDKADFPSYAVRIVLYYHYH